jgi:hypothetical protein
MICGKTLAALLARAEQSYRAAWWACVPAAEAGGAQILACSGAFEVLMVGRLLACPLQLMRVGDEGECAVVQFGKVERDIYILDFNPTGKPNG